MVLLALLSASHLEERAPLPIVEKTLVENHIIYVVPTSTGIRHIKKKE